MSITLREFIKIAEKAQEASIVVAKDSGEASEYVKLLENLGYFCVVDSQDIQKSLGNGKKAYGLISEKNADFYYNLAKDFGSGDIHLFDIKNQKKVWITPNRETSALILIIKQSDIEMLKQKGFDFSLICHGAYQNNDK